MNIKLYSCFHKKYVIPKNPYIRAIHVGMECSDNDLNIIGDNTGENISEKNKNFCELTALYWVWKNSNADIVGLCHYRRYFNFSNKLFLHKMKEIKKEELEKYNLCSKKDIERILIDGNYNIIVPASNKFNENIYNQYCRYHKEEDLNSLIKIIKKLYPDYLESTYRVLNGNKMSIYNMFICKKEVMDKYCEWLFNILFNLEKIVTIDKDPYQSRIFGFISERLLNIYIEKNNLKKKELQVLFVKD